MRDYMDILGLVLLALGGSFADSDNLIIPIVVTGIGALMMLYSSREEL